MMPQRSPIHTPGMGKITVSAPSEDQRWDDAGRLATPHRSMWLAIAQVQVVLFVLLWILRIRGEINWPAMFITLPLWGPGAFLAIVFAASFIRDRVRRIGTGSASRAGETR